jgi:hypothetical protein
LWGGNGRKKELGVKKYRIEFVIKVKDDIPPEQVEEWARFTVGDRGKMSLENPLTDESFDSVFGTFKISEVQQ